MNARPIERSRGVVLVLEDEQIVAQNVQSILSTAGYHVPAIATSVRELGPLYRAVCPELIIADITLGDDETDGIDAIASLQTERPVTVLYVSAYADAATIARASRRTRAVGFVVKPFVEKQLLAAVDVAISASREASLVDARLSALERTLSRIGTLLSHSGVWMTSDRLERNARVAHDLSSLSTRELDVLHTLITRRRVSLVAQDLGISTNAVRNHLKSIFVKLDVGSQDELFDKMTRLTR